MIPELGKYAIEVVSSYAITMALMLGLVWISLRRSRRVRDALVSVEKRMRRHG